MTPIQGSRQLLSLLLLILFFSVGPVSGQSAGRGDITGRVLGPDGAPLADIVVAARAVGKKADGQRFTATSATTDAEGNFRFSNLESRLYRVAAVAAGVPRIRFQNARIGDTVILRFERGGVITGRITGPDGLPLVETNVRFHPVPDPDRPPVERNNRQILFAQTDDRGQYRQWGLSPGRYLVSVQPQTGQTDGEDVETYYPGTPFAGARPVIVTEGGEATGIDIRHLAQSGLSIEGRVTGSAAQNGGWVRLFDAATRQSVDQTISGEDGRFSFSQITPGEYELIAEGNGQQVMLAGVPGGFSSDPEDLIDTFDALTPDSSSPLAFSEPVRVVVGTKNIANLTVPLGPARVINGAIRVAPPAKSLGEICGATASPVESTEILLVAKRNNLYITALNGQLSTTPDTAGQFRMNRLVPEDYALGFDLPAGWYVASATEPGTPKPKPLGSLLLKKGTSRENIAVTLEFGAATVKGTVSNLPKAVEEVEKLRVHLIPLDDAQVENTARYYEATVATDGGFEFKNLAPGRYAVIVQKKDVPAGENPAFPVALDPAKRKLLRDAAKSAKTLELTPCKTFEGVAVEVKP
jgi:protocatechuate 3,4-dioxygenase beta subunit